MFVNLIGPINALGYGVATLNILKHLIQAGHHVSYFPIGQPQWEDNQEVIGMIQMAIKNSEMFNPEAPSIRIWHQHDMAMFPGKGERIAWPIFELDKFNDKELHHLSGVDRIFVCSQWAKDVIEQNGITVPVDVIPLGVDNSVFYNDSAAKKSRPYHTKDSTIFMNVGKWEVRKGHNELLEAFNEAFAPDDNVELWMMNDNPFIKAGNEAWKRKYIGSKMGSKIRIWPRVPSQADLRHLYNQIDYGVFPSHAEGWNLEILEMMACGAGIIATNYSGHTEFLDDSNARLIHPKGMEVADDGVFFNGAGSWCKFDMVDLRASMKLAHNDRTKINNQPTIDKFSWMNTVKAIEEVL